MQSHQRTGCAIRETSEDATHDAATGWTPHHCLESWNHELLLLHARVSFATAEHLAPLLLESKEDVAAVGRGVTTMGCGSRHKSMLNEAAAATGSIFAAIGGS